MNPAPVIVKLGGSFAGDSRLADWGAMLAAAPCPVLIVPGGGPFADAVREAQGPMGYSDRAAHRMAILAMAQYGEALADRFRLPLAATEAEIAGLDAAAVWSPPAMALDDRALPTSWDLTSDSLAAWLAARTAARGLVLVKQALPANLRTAGDAAAAGLADPLFAAYAAALACPVWIAGPDGIAATRAMLGGGPAAGAGLIQLAAARPMRRAG